VDLLGTRMQSTGIHEPGRPERPGSGTALSPALETSISIQPGRSGRATDNRPTVGRRSRGINPSVRGRQCYVAVGPGATTCAGKVCAVRRSLARVLQPRAGEVFSLLHEVSFSIERRGRHPRRECRGSLCNARGCHELQIGLAGFRLPPECIAQSTGGSGRAW
jgi:hypothetical protein